MAVAVVLEFRKTPTKMVKLIVSYMAVGVAVVLAYQVEKVLQVMRVMIVDRVVRLILRNLIFLEEMEQHNLVVQEEIIKSLFMRIVKVV